MNFFGHAAVASWQSSEPRFVLGAMLPDFVAMIRARVPLAVDREIGRGIALHHATDLVFHDTPSFRELGAWAFEQLLEHGLPRGPARAVAHVGVEILLDGVLANDASARRAYLAGIALGRELDRGFIEWSRPADADRFAELVTALGARGVSRRHGSPDVVAFRIERALAGRPRIALEPAHTGLVLSWAEHARAVVFARAERLLQELREGLATRAAGC